MEIKFEVGDWTCSNKECSKIYFALITTCRKCDQVNNINMEILISRRI